MNRYLSAQGLVSPVSQQPGLYEKREVEPGTEEFQRRTGSVRAARYSQALGLQHEPRGSFTTLDASTDLTSDWSVAFSVNSGDIAELTGKWILFFAGSLESRTTANSIQCYLERTDASTYQVVVEAIDNSSTSETLTAIAVSPHTNFDLLVSYQASTGTLDLHVDVSSQSRVLTGTFANLDNSQFTFGGSKKVSTRPYGTAPVLDNIQVASRYITDTSTVYQDRTTSADVILKPNDMQDAMMTTSTGSQRMFLHPAPPVTDSSRVNFSGYGGCLRVPYHSIFDRFYKSKIRAVSSQEFAFRVSGLKRFPVYSASPGTDDDEMVLFDFGGNAVEGFCYLEITADQTPKFWYSGTSVSSTDKITNGSTFDIVCGCDGTNIYIQVNNGTIFTATQPTDLPYLEFERIPDLYIGADEDPDLDYDGDGDRDNDSDGHFHGYIDRFQFYDYPAKLASTDDVAALLDLDFSGDLVRDKSSNRIPVVAEAHAVTEGRPVLAPGPLTDQAFTAVDSGVVFGYSALGKLGSQVAPFRGDTTALRRGNKIFAHSVDTCHVIDSSTSQIRPLGLPEPQAEVSLRSVGIGALDGVYSYGYRWLTGDGTYGPVRRLKPVKALRGSSVLIGASTSGAGGSEERREFGESYGASIGGQVSYFDLRPSEGDIVDAGTNGISMEIPVRFPQFDRLKETVFDRGSTGNSFSDKRTMAVHSATRINLNPEQDFAMQLAFRYSELTGTYRHQALLTIGSDDSGPWTRDVMVFLYRGDDSTHYGWNGSANESRLVVAKATGRKNSAYTYVVFTEDDGFWVDGHDYNVFVNRDLEDLRIEVHDATDDTWIQMVETDFFQGYQSFADEWPFKATQAAHRKIGDFGNHYEDIHKLAVTTGAKGALNQRLGWIDRDSYIYHARAWSRAWPTTVIKRESEKRFTGLPGEVLSPKIRSDVAFFNDDVSENPRQFWDQAANMHWRSFKMNTSTDNENNPPKATLTQVAGTPVEYTALAFTDTADSAASDSNIRLYASAVGDGSIVLSTGESAYTLSGKVWETGTDDPNILPLSDLNLDLKNTFNFFTVSVAVSVTSGTPDTWELEVLDLAINGNPIFDGSIGAASTDLASDSARIYLGGHASQTNSNTTSDNVVEMAEFRLWNINRYDDANEQYDFLTSRVKDSERSDMYYYATFEPADDNGSTIDQHGEDPATSADVLTITGGAKIVDSRADEDSEVADPAPAIAIPDPPYPWITGIQWFRSFGRKIEDTDDEAEIQNALLASQGDPLFALVTTTAHENSYVDTILDDALGAESPEPGSGFFPFRINGIGIWQNQLLVFKDGDIWFAEPGPFGWESFPSWLRYRVPASGSGGDITATLELQGNLLVFGQSWGSLLTGAPSRPQHFSLGQGVGAQSPRAVASYGGSAFALSDTNLWRIVPGQDPENFGLPVQDLLPSAGRLAVSSQLSSLFVIDEDNDVVLRFHFPTQSWSIEERDLLALGDVSGTATMVHGSGAYSQHSTSVYGDDVDTLTGSTDTGTISDASTVGSVATDPNLGVDARVLVVDSSGNTVATRFVSYSGTDLTVTANSLSGLSGAVTLYYGAGPSGVLIDTGWFTAGPDESELGIRCDIQSGSGWEFSLANTVQPGDRSSLSGLTFTALATGDQRTRGSGRGRWTRGLVRSRVPEQSKLGVLDLEIFRTEQ